MSASARVTLNRTHKKDVGQRQVVVTIDDGAKTTLMFGETATLEIPPGDHVMKAHNTLVWKTVPFDAAPGQDVQFTVWNQPMGGWPMRLLFIFIGAAALKLGIAPGPPDASRAGRS